MKRTGRALRPTTHFCTIETCTFARQLAGPPVVVEDREDPATKDLDIEEQRVGLGSPTIAFRSDQIQN